MFLYYFLFVPSQPFHRNINFNINFNRNSLFDMFKYCFADLPVLVEHEFVSSASAGSLCFTICHFGLVKWALKASK